MGNCFGLRYPFRGRGCKPPLSRFSRYSVFVVRLGSSMSPALIQSYRVDEGPHGVLLLFRYSVIPLFRYRIVWACGSIKRENWVVDEATCRP